MLNYVIPFVERLAAGEISSDDKEVMRQIQERRDVAQIVTNYLRKNGDSQGYYDAVGSLLRMPEYRRLLLYLPLLDLKTAPAGFRGAYLDAWYELLSVQDARENFYVGDTFEVDARPGGQLERVVKCAHLTPWLVEAGFLGYAELKSILSLNQDNDVLLRSFANTWRLIRRLGLFAEAEMCDLESLTAHVAQRAQLKPLYVSEGRKKWLREQREQARHEILLTPKTSLAGPFSPNIKAFMNDLEALQARLKPKEIILVGGSRLKGYGTFSSDLDVFSLKELEKNPEMGIGSPHAAHIYYNTVWLGGSQVYNLREIAASYAKAYFGRDDRRLVLERLESDLLQYRLLHKGFAKFYGGHNSTAKDYPEMDGNCPFYDDQYRRIATELFVKYVFVPYSST